MSAAQQPFARMSRTAGMSPWGEGRLAGENRLLNFPRRYDESLSSAASGIVANRMNWRTLTDGCGTIAALQCNPDLGWRGFQHYATIFG
jgi:hypothetical protein